MNELKKFDFSLCGVGIFVSSKSRWFDECDARALCVDGVHNTCILLSLSLSPLSVVESD
jgi:hypothetical protein